MSSQVTVRETLNSNLFFLITSPCPFLNPADDMGLGKTLTMISLILAKKKKEKEEDEKRGEKKLEKWISKTGNYDISFFQFIR